MPQKANTSKEEVKTEAKDRARSRSLRVSALLTYNICVFPSATRETRQKTEKLCCCLINEK